MATDGVETVSVILDAFAETEIDFCVPFKELKDQVRIGRSETLELASRNWHTGSHDAWPYINYLLFTLKNVYKEFESRFANTQAPRGEKSELVINVINSFTGTFTVRQIEQQCPGVSRELIRKIMKQHDTCLKCTGKGPAAVWKRVRVLPLSKGKNKGIEEVNL